MSAGRVKVWAVGRAGQPCPQPLVCLGAELLELSWAQWLQGLWVPPLLCCAKCSFSACLPYHHFKAVHLYICFIAHLSSSQSERMTYIYRC